MLKIPNDPLYTRAIRGYDRVLLGRIRSHDPAIFHSTPEINEQRACWIIRYVSEYYLHWTPDQLASNLTLSVVTRWSLANVIKYIRFPEGMHWRRHLWWVAHKCYPNVISGDLRTAHLRIYEKMLCEGTRKWPKEFFCDQYAKAKLASCLVFAINQFSPPPCGTKVPDLYEFFASQQVWPYLQKIALKDKIKEIFDHPIDCLDIALGEHRSEVLSSYWRVNAAYLSRVPPAQKYDNVQINTPLYTAGHKSIGGALH